MWVFFAGGWFVLHGKDQAALTGPGAPLVPHLAPPCLLLGAPPPSRHGVPGAQARRGCVCLSPGIPARQPLGRWLWRKESNPPESRNRSRAGDSLVGVFVVRGHGKSAKKKWGAFEMRTFDCHRRCLSLAGSIPCGAIGADHPRPGFASDSGCGHALPGRGGSPDDLFVPATRLRAPGALR